ncbi:MAG: hypothetical protein IT288_09360 [Bdellovibrionales bacterium]|nr:hypothetical protein [Bdellovibrionales bacterium]
MSRIKLRLMAPGTTEAENYSDSAALREFNQTIQSAMNQLLVDSRPNRLRRHQLSKILLREGSDRPELVERIDEFYQIPPRQRSDREFARLFGIKPYPWLRNQFDLNFGQAEVPEVLLYKLSLKVRDFIKSRFTFPGEISNAQMFHLVLYSLTRPRWDEPRSSIDLNDFVRVWRRACLKWFGDRYQIFFKILLDRVNNVEFEVDILNPSSLADLTSNPSAGDQSLTQTELDWLKRVLTSIQLDWSPPAFPLSSGPQNKVTREIEKVCRILHLQSQTQILPATDEARLKEHLSLRCREWLSHYNQYQPLTKAELRTVLREIKAKKEKTRSNHV